MFRSKVFRLSLVMTFLIGMTPLRESSEAASSPTHSPAFQNKFVGRWSSRIKNSAGETIDDGVLYISDTTEPSDNEVSVSHSTGGGPVVGHTMDYPDRIEIQISLGDGRVAHYNGVLVSANKIEGKYFVTGQPNNHHARKHLPVGEGGEWTAQAGST
ncbi:MAG TPA: hypothetical protein VJ372_15370 [Pyrinomonadaceae bacterium]|nr:hypothetical protein [Pyrinomonadaceae bacterium]